MLRTRKTDDELRAEGLCPTCNGKGALRARRLDGSLLEAGRDGMTEHDCWDCCDDCCGDGRWEATS